jgi:hypothetical protein
VSRLSRGQKQAVIKSDRTIWRALALAGRSNTSRSVGVVANVGSINHSIPVAGIGKHSNNSRSVAIVLDVGVGSNQSIPVVARSLLASNRSKQDEPRVESQ